MSTSDEPDQTAPIGAVCPGFTLFTSILNSSVMLGNYLQQTTSADDIFRCIFFLGALRVNLCKHSFLFVGHRHTVPTQIRRRRTRRLISDYTVCLQIVPSSFE